MAGLFTGLRRAFGKERPPKEARQGIDPDDRILTFATLTDGSTMVATRRGLWLPDREERLLPWHRVIKALWGSGALTLIEGIEAPGGVLEEAPARSYRLAEPRRLPHTVRQRVEHSVGYSTHHELRPEGGVRIVGRRVAGQDGLTWYLVFDRGTDREDPQVAAQTAELLTRARAATGL